MHENERRSLFVEDFLSRMRKVRIPYKASVSGNPPFIEGGRHLASSLY